MSTPSPLAQAAKAVRADIKAALAAGELPAHPDGIKIRVRSSSASLTAAIDIDVENAPYSWAYTGGGNAVSRPTPANLLLRDALREIAGRHFHADGRGSFITVQVHLEREA